MNLIDPTAAMALLVAVSLVALVGVALVAVLAAHEYVARRPAGPARPTARPVRGFTTKVAASH